MLLQKIRPGPSIAPFLSQMNLRKTADVPRASVRKQPVSRVLCAEMSYPSPPA